MAQLRGRHGEEALQLHPHGVPQVPFLHRGKRRARQVNPLRGKNESRTGADQSVAGDELAENLLDLLEADGLLRGPRLVPQGRNGERRTADAAPHGHDRQAPAGRVDPDHGAKPLQPPSSTRRLVEPPEHLNPFLPGTRNFHQAPHDAGHVVSRSPRGDDRVDARRGSAGEEGQPLRGQKPLPHHRRKVRGGDRRFLPAARQDPVRRLGRNPRERPQDDLRGAKEVQPRGIPVRREYPRKKRIVEFPRHPLHVHQFADAPDLPVARRDRLGHPPVLRAFRPARPGGVVLVLPVEDRVPHPFRLLLRKPSLLQDLEKDLLADEVHVHFAALALDPDLVRRVPVLPGDRCRQHVVRGQGGEKRDGPAHPRPRLEVGARFVDPVARRHRLRPHRPRETEGQRPEQDQRPQDEQERDAAVGACPLHPPAPPPAGTGTTNAVFRGPDGDGTLNSTRTAAGRRPVSFESHDGSHSHAPSSVGPGE